MIVRQVYSYLFCRVGDPGNYRSGIGGSDKFLMDLLKSLALAALVGLLCGLITFYLLGGRIILIAPPIFGREVIVIAT